MADPDDPGGDDDFPDPEHMHRWDDPNTSRAAARVARRVSGRDRRRVWRYGVKCGAEGYTHLELHRAMDALYPHEVSPETKSTYRSRSNDLVRLGHVINTGRKRVNLPSKRERIVWRVLTRDERQAVALARPVAGSAGVVEAVSERPVDVYASLFGPRR